MVNAGERSSNETREESEGALMPKRAIDARRRVKGKRKHHKRETNVQWAVLKNERQSRWILEGIPVLNAEYPDSEEFDPDSEEPEGTSLTRLQHAANVYIEQLVRQIHRCCSDKKWNSYQKRVACEQLVKLALLSTNSMYGLAKEFPEPFREIAEELPHFPCLFPAHAEELRSLQKVMWDHFNLGKRHELKLRAAPRRKTFSKKTWVNAVLIRLIELVHESARRQDELDPDWDYCDKFREVVRYVPLTPENVKQWLEVMWKLLLIGTPNPENHPRLRQLGGRPSRKEKRVRQDGTVGKKTQALNVRVSIKEKLGVYLERMLNDSAAKQMAE